MQSFDHSSAQAVPVVFYFLLFYSPTPKERTINYENVGNQLFQSSIEVPASGTHVNIGRYKNVAGFLSRSKGNLSIAAAPGATPAAVHLCEVGVKTIEYFVPAWFCVSGPLCAWRAFPQEMISWCMLIHVRSCLQFTSYTRCGMNRMGMYQDSHKQYRKHSGTRVLL